MEKYRRRERFLRFISALYIILTEEIKFPLYIKFPSCCVSAFFYSEYNPYCDAYGFFPTQ